MCSDLSIPTVLKWHEMLSCLHQVIINMTTVTVNIIGSANTTSTPPTHRGDCLAPLPTLQYWVRSGDLFIDSTPSHLASIHPEIRPKSRPMYFCTLLLISCILHSEPAGAGLIPAIHVPQYQSILTQVASWFFNTARLSSGRQG